MKQKDFQKDYINAFSSISPTDAFREQLMIQIQQAQSGQAASSAGHLGQAPVTRIHPSRFLAICAYGSLLLMLVWGIRQLIPPGSPAMPTQDDPIPAQSSPVASPSLSASGISLGTTISSQSGPTLPSISPAATSFADDFETILYSSLKLSGSEAVQLPPQLTQGSLTDRMRPGNYAEVLKEHADLVVKATILQVRLKQYSVRFHVKPSDYKAFLTAEENKYRFKTIHTIVFEARIDQIYRDLELTSTGLSETLLVEQMLYPLDSDDPYLFPRAGRQYVLALNRRENMDLVPAAEAAQYDAIDGEHMAEGRYSLLFDQTPQIERTLDGGYLFYADPSVYIANSGSQKGAGWTALIKPSAKKIIMPDVTNSIYQNSMWVRSDAEADADLKALLR